MWSEQYKDCLDYIESFWDQVIHKPEKRVVNHNVITIPHPYVTPNAKKFKFMFYWDSFFILRGVIGTKREWLLKNMVENFVFTYKKYGIIPNFNSPASMGRSQPPFLTSMILDTYNGHYFRYLKHKKLKKVFLFNLKRHQTWLKNMTMAAKEEYEKIWLDHEGLYNHKVKGHALSRYGDRDIGYAHSSELESGWDFTSRFYNRCDEFLPIDLNVLLFKYERDFGKIAQHLGELNDEINWKGIAEERKKEINRLMWDEKSGFFYDYGYVYKRRSEFLSLAGFTPLWAGIATKEQAKRMVKKLKHFETPYGLAITTKESLAPKVDLSKLPERYVPALEEILLPKQWDYPNSWPPLEYLTVIGLLKYGFVKDAKRLMEKYIKTHAKIFREHKTFFEKIDAVKGDIGVDFHYQSQGGFGWTNAAFYRYIQILDTLERGDNIYAEPKAELPPFKLSIIH